MFIQYVGRAVVRQVPDSHQPESSRHPNPKPMCFSSDICHIPKTIQSHTVQSPLHDEMQLTNLFG